MKKLISFILVITAVISCKQRDRKQYQSQGNKKDNSINITKQTNDSFNRKTRFLENDDGKNIKGKVIRIIDGDTFVLLLNNDFDTGVRLNGIDCPEKKQAFSQKAKKTLSELIFNKEVTVYYDKKDGFGRVLGDVFVGNINVNHEMVRQGLAWHYVKYSNDEALAELEKEARENRVGLWSEPSPIAPWEYRSK